MNYKKASNTDNININDPDGVWIGDPCYVIPGDQWDVWCDSNFAHERANPDLPRCYIAECEHYGYKFYTWSTAYGDGCYPLFVNDNIVANLGVDAGTLSAIPMSLIKHWHQTGEIGDYEDMGHVIDSKHVGGEMTMDQGDLFWGDVRLPTGGLDSDEDEDEEQYWEDEEEHA